MNWRSIFGATALLLAVAGTACSDEGEPGESSGPSCAPGDTACGDACVDVSSDPRHCGGCGNACGEGEVCNLGRCEAGCPEGLIECGGGCWDITSSNRHCGSCGFSCRDGEACVGSRCTLTCPPGQALCAGACHSTDTSPDHCGGCGIACGAGEVCADGTCVTSCPAGQTACDGGCWDLDSSEAHCGACGNACAPGLVCEGGSCGVTSCAEGYSECDARCVDVQSDRNHCGACGVTCGGSEVCIDGSCQLLCLEGSIECDGACRDPQVDPNHCGACGNACDGDERCVNGSCVLACDGFMKDACEGACTNFDVDPENCGACGNACADGEVCSNGVCALTCTGDADLCGGGCTDVDNDPMNCGRCGRVCRADPNGIAICNQGECETVCPPTHADCNLDLNTAGSDGCEVNVFSDPLNCGSCGNVCDAVEGGVPACGRGACASVCAPGFADCDLNPANGCETYVVDDPNNCGHCYWHCPPGNKCEAGWCSPVALGDHCHNPLVLQGGVNLVEWDEATNQDHITTLPACSPSTSYTPLGPDVALRYDATFDGEVTFSIAKPASTRWHLKIYEGNCNDRSELRCESDFSLTSWTHTIPVQKGKSYFLVLVDTSSGTLPLSNPLEVEVIEPNAGGDDGPCPSGQGGVLSRDYDRVWSGWVGAFTENYMAVDPDPNGWVYVGGTTSLKRFRKAGGELQDVYNNSPITSTNLGYAMLIDGPKIYTAESKTTGTNGHLFRVSTDGGTTWSVQDAANFPVVPGADITGLAVWGDRLFMLTNESTRSQDTEIWSIDRNATAIDTAVLERAFGANVHHYCSGLVVDSTYFYTACTTTTSTTENFAVIKVHRGTGSITTLLDGLTGSSTVMSLVGADANGDDLIDVLYFREDLPEIHVVCNVNHPTEPPSGGLFVRWGTDTANYGLAYDAASNTLWAYDGPTQGVLVFQ